MNFDNHSFWNERYRNEPWLGSGPGSRGSAASYKDALMNHFIGSGSIASILDVGCGDCCWINDSAAWLQNSEVRYLGLDISETVIESNRKRLSMLSFDCFNLLSSDLPDDFDLVVCFDVLIHQCERESFELALERLLSSIHKYGLISYITSKATSPVLPAISGNDAVQHEIAFQEQMRNRSGDIRRAPTQNFGELSELIIKRDSSISVAVLGKYRYQTIYKLIRPGLADIFQLPEKV